MLELSRTKWRELTMTQPSEPLLKCITRVFNQSMMLFVRSPVFGFSNTNSNSNKIECRLASHLIWNEMHLYQAYATPRPIRGSKIFTILSYPVNKIPPLKTVLPSLITVPLQNPLNPPSSHRHLIAATVDSPLAL